MLVRCGVTMARQAGMLLYLSMSLYSLCFALFDGYDKSIHFELDWKGPWRDADFEKSLYTEVIPITTAANEKYRCVVPVDDESQYFTKTADEYIGPSARSLLEKEWADMTKHGCSYRIDTYWTYELCHGEYMRQYHQDEVAGKTKLQEYFLGYFPKSQPQKLASSKAPAASALFEFPVTASEQASLPVMKADGTEFPYYEILIDGGTKCDVSNRPRQARLRFICVPNGGLRIQSVDEVSSCEYVVVVQSSQLCRHPAYKPKTTPVHQIACYNEEGTTHVVPDGLMNEVMQLKEMHGNSKRHLHPRLHAASLIDENKLYTFHADKTKKVKLASMEGLIDSSLRTTISTETGGAGDDTEEFILEVDTGNGKDRTQILFKRAKFPPGTAGEIGTTGGGNGAAGDIFSGDNLRAMAEQVLNAGGLGGKLAGAHQISTGSAGAPSSEYTAKVENSARAALDFFLGSTCLYGGSGYWKVEYCFNRHVRQFHDSPSSSSAKIILGKWNEKAHREWVATAPKDRKPHLVHGPQPYRKIVLTFSWPHSVPYFRTSFRVIQNCFAPIENSMVKHHYGNGDYCHDVNAHRQTEVVFKCKTTAAGESHVANAGAASSIFLLEPSTCSYTLMVESPFVCLLAENSDTDGIIQQKYIYELLDGEEAKMNAAKKLKSRKAETDRASELLRQQKPENDADSAAKRQKPRKDAEDYAGEKAEDPAKGALGEHLFHFELSSDDLAELDPDQAVEKFRKQVSKTMRDKMTKLSPEDTVRALHSSMQKILKEFTDTAGNSDADDEESDEEDENGADNSNVLADSDEMTTAELLALAKKLNKRGENDASHADDDLLFLHPDIYTDDDQTDPKKSSIDSNYRQETRYEMNKHKVKLPPDSAAPKNKRVVPNAYTMGKYGEAQVTRVAGEDDDAGDPGAAANRRDQEIPKSVENIRKPSKAADEQTTTDYLRRKIATDLNGAPNF